MNVSPISAAASRSTSVASGRPPRADPRPQPIPRQLERVGVESVRLGGYASAQFARNLNDCTAAREDALGRASASPQRADRQWMQRRAHGRPRTTAATATASASKTNTTRGRKKTISSAMTRVATTPMTTAATTSPTPAGTSVQESQSAGSVGPSAKRRRRGHRICLRTSQTRSSGARNFHVRDRRTGPRLVTATVITACRNPRESVRLRSTTRRKSRTWWSCPVAATVTEV